MLMVAEGNSRHVWSLAVGASLLTSATLGLLLIPPLNSARDKTLMVHIYNATEYTLDSHCMLLLRLHCRLEMLHGRIGQHLQ